MGFELPVAATKALEQFAVELKKWNRKVNLTALIADDDIAVKHLVDSIVVSGWVKGSSRALDIGSGAGVPAIPLKIMLPETHIVSVDAVAKKIFFQRHVSRVLGLQGFEAIHDRVENLCTTHSGTFDVIISRAFSRLDTFVSLAAPLLAPGGRIIAMKGPAVDDEVMDTHIFQNRGLRITASHTYYLPLDKGERRLVIISGAEVP